MSKAWSINVVNSHLKPCQLTNIKQQWERAWTSKIRQDDTLWSVCTETRLTSTHQCMLLYKCFTQCFICMWCVYLCVLICSLSDMIEQRTSPCSCSLQTERLSCLCLFFPALFSPSAHPVCICPLSRGVSSAGLVWQKPRSCRWPLGLQPASPPCRPCGIPS